MKKELFLSLFFILLLGTMAFGVLIFSDKKSPVQSLKQTQNSETPHPVITEDPDGKSKYDISSTKHYDTSGWETYVDPDYGFRFKYPKELRIMVKKDKEGLLLENIEFTNTEEFKKTFLDDETYTQDRQTQSERETVANTVLGPFKLSVNIYATSTEALIHSITQKEYAFDDNIILKNKILSQNKMALGNINLEQMVVAFPKAGPPQVYGVFNLISKRDITYEILWYKISPQDGIFENVFTTILSTISIE